MCFNMSQLKRKISSFLVVLICADVGLNSANAFPFPSGFFAPCLMPTHGSFKTRPEEMLIGFRTMRSWSPVSSEGRTMSIYMIHNIEWTELELGILLVRLYQKKGLLHGRSLTIYTRRCLWHYSILNGEVRWAHRINIIFQNLHRWYPQKALELEIQRTKHLNGNKYSHQPQCYRKTFENITKSRAMFQHENGIPKAEDRNHRKLCLLCCNHSSQIYLIHFAKFHGLKVQLLWVGSYPFLYKIATSVATKYRRRWRYSSTGGWTCSWMCGWPSNTFPSRMS